VYRGNTKTCESLLDYALYVSFFPTLLAGPIIRAPQFLAQLRTDTDISKDSLSSGFSVFVIGLFKKVFIADRLALFVDSFFPGAGAFDTTTTWLAVAAYTLQIYLDFSGYSDMAIGIARMLGYELEENFNLPYLARSVREFWRRWHMSLSFWIRDYVYISLGGSRKGEIRSYLNLFFAMVLCGLWHGASWTFVFWGAYHGAALAVNRIFNTVKAWITFQHDYQFIADGVSRILTLLTVMIGWVFFRSVDLHQALTIVRHMFWFTDGVSWPYPFAIAACLAAGIYHLVEVLGITKAHRLPLNAWYTPAVLFSMLWLVVMFRPEGFNPFVYVRF
jgi:alginate O-acetyltransferase complex protein AlgI